MAESGELIGPYRLISPLGKGAMGEVWRARDERLDRYVALKVLPADLAGDVERRARMLREARAAAAIRHANVVTLFDIVSHAGEDILVMELVEGRTLSEALRQDGAPPLERALGWIEGVADALVAAHGRGILHRDIKAANIMVTPDGVKVLDFGLAKVIGAPEAPGTAGGPDTPDVPGTAGVPDTPGVLDTAGDTWDGSPRRADLAAVSSVTRTTKIALDATMPSGSDGPRAEPSDGSGDGPGDGSGPRSIDHSQRATLGGDGYRTHAGQLLGTPLYMAPEQIDGGAPDERSEVFSVGVLAHEILRGRPPYTATTIYELFAQIAHQPPPALDDVPAAIEAIVGRALAKDPAGRYPTMRAFRDAIAAERRRRFTRGARRWPVIAAAAVAVAVAAVAAGLWWSGGPRAAPARPGDDYVRRALEEYDLFYNDKALSSLRAALAVAPEHPRALAYLVLFGGASEAERTRAAAAAEHARDAIAAHTKDRALLDTARTLVEHGPQAARAELARAGADPDRELAFWAAELDYRAADYRAAHAAYQALLAEPAHELRGRIYDHETSVLLYLDEPAEALRIGTLYRDAFPGEADAVGVYATTLAAAGELARAVAAAEEAVRLSEGEDTLAGLAKVVALSGDRTRARQLYQQSLDKAGANRRPVRRAALGLLAWIDGELDAARAAVAPCLAGGTDATVPERGACLFVAGVIDPARAAAIAGELAALARTATDAHPAYGAPGALAQLVRARARFFGGGCVVDPARADAAVPAQPARSIDAYVAPVDFYAAYHLPFFATWQVCEHAALLAAGGDLAAAAALLRPVAERAPARRWLLDTLARYRGPRAP
jgi:serine/threonine protein kinase